MDGWWDDGGFDDFDDRAECPCFGEVVPLDHLDTDSGDCIGCEDRREQEEWEQYDAED